MNELDEDALCPCDSGLKYSQCCGVPGLAAINADITARVSVDGIKMFETFTPELQASVDQIKTTPDLFPARIQFSENKVYFVKMSPQWYEESVFLDPARMKGTRVIESNFEWLKEATEGLGLQTMPMIFHTAFCGSTLMSQALGAVYGSLSLREPEILGSIVHYLRLDSATAEDKDEWFNRLMGLLSRRYEPDHPVIIKTNDNADPLMLDVLQRIQGAQVLFMYTPLGEFLSGCLKTKNRRQWISGRYQSVCEVASKLLSLPEDFSVSEEAYGEMAAVYWSYNVALFQEAWRCAPNRLRSLNFNHMLEDPMKSMMACADLFNLKQRSDADPVEELDKLFGVYSKNSKLKYSPQKRRDDIDQILSENAAELEASESLAKKLLGDDYPDGDLPGSLLG